MGALPIMLWPLRTIAQLIAGATLVVLALVIQVRRNQQSSSGPLALLAATLFLFVWARPLIAFTSDDFNIRTIELFSGIPVSAHGQAVYFAAELCSMVAFSITIFCFQIPTRKSTRSVILKASYTFFPNAPDIWILLMTIGAIFSFVQTALFLRYFLQGGSYVELYLLGPDAIEYPGLSFLSSLLFYGYIGFLLASQNGERNRTLRVRRFWTCAFIVLSLLSLARGTRGEVFTQLLTGLWLFSFTGKKLFSIRIWLVAGVLLFLLSETVSNLRTGSEVKLGSIDLSNAVKWFVFSQGVSGELVAVADEAFGVGLSNTRFLVAPLLGPVRRIIDPSFGTQSVHYGEMSGLLSHELSFRVAPEYYLAGRATGSSYIAETYCAFGLIGIVAATTLLAWYVLNGPQLAQSSLSLFFIFSGSLPYVLFVPRDSLALPVIAALKALLILVVCWKLRSLYVHYGHSAHLQSRSTFESNYSKLHSGGRE